MSEQPTIQHRMDEAVDNYLSLSELLREDVNALLDTDLETPTSRRNFIRAAAAMIEGLTHSIREICLVGIECGAQGLSRKEILAITCERSGDTHDRYKRTVLAGYKMFSISPLPDFSGVEWCRARKMLYKRHSLMHPKKASDFEVEASSWADMEESVIWMFAQLFRFFELLPRKQAG